MKYLNAYNIVWETQSRNSEESMPVGGGDIGLNAWVEGGDLLFYIGRSGSFDENNQMLKLGRVRLRLDPNPFVSDSYFRQRLTLEDGSIVIDGKSPTVSATLRIWVEVHKPVIHVEIESRENLSAEVLFECWRSTEREFPFDGKMGSRWAIFGLEGYPGRLVTYADTVEFKDNGILWYHRNRNGDSMYDKLIQQQELESVQDRITDTLKNRTFGGYIQGTDMVCVDKGYGVYADIPFVSHRLRSRNKARSHSFQVCLHTSQCETLVEWIQQLMELTESANHSRTAAWEATQSWWSDFWTRSHLVMKTAGNTELGSDKAWQIGRNYQLFRYMLACNAFGDYPTKFNGGFFTYDPCHITWHDTYTPKNETPDYRAWGSAFTAQNQRLVYWPMLKSGDFELMHPQFEFYRKALPAAEARTELYWGHRGCSFTEQIEHFGLPLGVTYGWRNSYSAGRNRPPDFERGLQTSVSVRYEYVHQLDFSMMILEYHRYTGNDISVYMPFIESSLEFYDLHYQYLRNKRTGSPLEENGNLDIYPADGCETFHDAKNPADVVAGLSAVLRRMLELPESLVSGADKSKWGAMLDRIPPLPTIVRNGRTVFVPAENIHDNGTAPREIPQLYGLFPFGIFGKGKEEYRVAQDTWTHGGLNDTQKESFLSWYQPGIFTARLGRTKEAADFAWKKLGDSGRRFPAFWGPGDDWVPDHNWGGSGMIGLQDMLMQSHDDMIYLLPAWPVDWDVDFKLHAPQQTTVEGTVRNGSLVRLEVDPVARRKDVVICELREES